VKCHIQRTDAADRKYLFWLRLFGAVNPKYGTGSGSSSGSGSGTGFGISISDLNILYVVLINP
jgi:hypothetical protein